MIAIIVALASMLSIYWFLRLVWENKHFEYKFDISIISNKTLKILGSWFVILLMIEYIIVFYRWGKPIDNELLFYYDLFIVENLLVCSKYKKITNYIIRFSRSIEENKLDV